jgi:predicted phage tail component-like protein
VTTLDVPGRDGSVFATSKLKPLEISVYVRLKVQAASYLEMSKIRRDLTGYLFVSEPAKLVLPDEPDLYYMAMCTDSSDLDSLWRFGSCTLTFTAYDPVAFGDEVTKDIATDTATKLWVDGTYKTYPVYTLTGTGDVIKVTSMDTSAYVQTIDKVDKGTEIVIDMANQRVTRGGSYFPVTLGSDFTALDVGNNNVKVAGASGSVTWSERWL